VVSHPSRRSLLLGALGAVAAGTLSACGARSTTPVTSGEVDLRIWTHDPGYATTFTKAATDPAITGGTAFTFQPRITSAAPGDIVTRMIAQAVADGNTPDLLYVVFTLLVVVPAALLIAQALHARGLRGRDVFRLAFFMPVVISPIVITLVFGLFFDTEFGIVNGALKAVFGFGGVDWTGDPTWAKAPVTAFVAVTVLVSTAQIFDEPFLLTQGGPGESTLSVAMFVYRAGFQRRQLGYAAAAGVVLFLVVVALGLLANRLLGVGRDSR
jgi:ABC-type spermidine/putrescine transport system permease subunit I